MTQKSPIAACIQAGRTDRTMASFARPSRPCEPRQWVSLQFFSVERGIYPEHADSIEDAIRIARETGCAWIFTKYDDAEAWLREEAERFCAEDRAANPKKYAAMDRAIDENRRRFPELYR